MMRRAAFISLVAVAVLSAPAVSAKEFNPAAHDGSVVAGGTTVPIAKCVLSGPGVVVCGGIAILTSELVKALNGEKAFGRNGEIIKILRNPAGGRNSEVRKAGRWIDRTFNPFRW